MADSFVLSEKDLVRIAEMVRTHMGRRINTVGRVGELRVDHEETFLPEVYVGLTPYGGIPAMELACGTGSGTCDTDPYEVNDKPGYADCMLRRIMTEHEEEITDNQPSLITTPLESKRVYNLSSAEIPKFTNILAIRDKYGNFIAIPTAVGVTEEVTDCAEINFAKLNSNDAILVTYTDEDTETLVYLSYDSYVGSWTNPTEEFIWPTGGGQGPFEFFFSEGRPRLQLSGLDLIQCGDGCYVGSWVTGHGLDQTGTGLPYSELCNGETFTVCLSCTCPSISGWDGEGYYCIRDALGTSAICEPQLLLDEDRCDTTIEICSGPYATLEEAEVACTGTGTSTGTMGTGTAATVYLLTCADGGTGGTFTPTVSGDYLVECIGGGGGGSPGTGVEGGNAGGGGAYSASILTLTAGHAYTYACGGGGAGGIGGGSPGTLAQDTTWETTVIVAKAGGLGTTGAGPGLGGSAGAGTGTTKFSGGNGGITIPSSGQNGAGGGSSADAAGNGVDGSMGGAVPGAGGNAPSDGGDGGVGGTAPVGIGATGGDPGGGAGAGAANGNGGNGKHGMVRVTGPL